MELKSKERLDRGLRFYRSSILIATVICMFTNVPAMAEVKSSFLYDLSNFTGPIKYSAPRLSIDEERNEISVLYQNTIRVFNDSGMEIYRFGDDLDVGQIVDVATDKDGNILLLTYKIVQAGTYRCEIVRCNFRGEPKGILTLNNLPAQFSGFSGNRMVYQKGKLYFVDLSGLRLVICDDEGKFIKGYDLFSLLELKEKDRGNVEMWGFNVNEDGAVLFTIPVLFTAYKLAPDGKISFFGKPGGAPGRFNIVTGIAEDRAGNILVVDRLKSTVMVFDKKYTYLTQFGFRGFRPGNLIAPNDVAVDKAGRVYVTQNSKRGVSVFRLTYN